MLWLLSFTSFEASAGRNSPPDGCLLPAARPRFSLLRPWLWPPSMASSASSRWPTGGKRRKRNQRGGKSEEGKSMGGGRKGESSEWVQLGEKVVIEICIMYDIQWLYLSLCAYCGSYVLLKTSTFHCLKAARIPWLDLGSETHQRWMQISIRSLDFEGLPAEERGCSACEEEGNL